MISMYRVFGMTCNSCELKVSAFLMQLDQVISVKVSKERKEVVIASNTPIVLEDLQKALFVESNKYQIFSMHHKESKKETKSWWETYKPIVLIAVYLLAITILIQFANGTFDWSSWMRHFMAGFFLTFSFFKLLNLSGFAKSYRMYDVIARKFPSWGYIYAFLELGLGIAFLMKSNPLVVSIATFVIMSISIIGVLQTVLNKKKIQCACLGDVFNLPMSTITIIEDGLMIAMSVVMIIAAL